VEQILNAHSQIFLQHPFDVDFKGAACSSLTVLQRELRINSMALGFNNNLVPL
jgi:hypothetical protein